MRILCVSDTTQSLVYSPAGKDYFGKVDLALSCGDLPLEMHDYISTVYHCDTYYVFGNHNLQHYDQVLHFSKSHEDPFNDKFYGFMLDGKCIYDKKRDLIVAGLGGSMLYNNGKSQYTERQMKKRIARLAPKLALNKMKYGRYLDILITHAAPFGIDDAEDLCHMGFKCFLDFMDKYQPKYLLHGHVHLDDRNANRVSHYNNTTVINVFRNYMLEDEELGISKES